MFSKISNFFKDTSAKGEKRVTEEKLEQLEYMKSLIIRESITCRCKGLAVPLIDTPNKYYCVKCKARFVNTKHYFYSKIYKNKNFCHVVDHFFGKPFRDPYISQNLIHKLYNEVIKELELDGSN